MFLEAWSSLAALSFPPCPFVETLDFFFFSSALLEDSFWVDRVILWSFDRDSSIVWFLLTMSNVVPKFGFLEPWIDDDSAVLDGIVDGRAKLLFDSISKLN